MYHLLTYILIIFSINHSIYCSYQYAGCYTQVFHDTYFASSFMEPTLCFRLCDTPIIYLQKTICRCSGGGLMHYNRQNDGLCTIPCTKPADRSVKSANTCGGSMTYSAYVQENFFALHGHLFDYQIHFSSCELWKTDVYETYDANFDDIPVKSSLNRLEKCAAICLDQNSTTKSIAFNGNNNKCLCIMPLKPNKIFDRTHYLTILPNSSCDQYCNTIYEGSKSAPKYQCGSKTNPQIWAIYDLKSTCPLNYIYIKELKKCLYTYKNFWNSCTPPSVSFVYDGSLTWKDFLKIIDRLRLNNSVVSIDFDESVIIDRSWKCSRTTTVSTADTWRSYSSQSRSTLYGWNSKSRYTLENGCLRKSAYSSYSHRYSHRLCITDTVNKYSSTDTNDDNNNATYIFAVNPQTKFCPDNWFDLNGRCYRISEERKTIEQARDSCISVSTMNQLEMLNKSPTGQIVEYVSEWQARLAFFLLDTDSDDNHDYANKQTTSTIQSLYYDDDNSIDIVPELINEFQIIESNENKNTCIIIERVTYEAEEKPSLKNTKTTNCSQPRHVLCETNTLVVQNFQYACLIKPNILDLPAVISNHLTHELCLSVCQELQTKLALLHMNKCYCLNGANPYPINITSDFEKYRQTTCGNPCPGNFHEVCGNDNTIVAVQILESRRTFAYDRTPTEPFPNYVLDSCIQLNIFNQSITYQFTIDDRENFNPRYCLAFCTKYKQKYALINNKECLCTNSPMKDDYVDILSGKDCSQQCSGNYFYSCGNKDNSKIYSMYVLQPKCRHGFEVAENDQQCVYTHFSSKTNSLSSAQTYCQSIGGKLAEINDIIEIQDILPDSILHTRLMQQLLVSYKFKFINDTRLFWIDRTNEDPNSNTISTRLLKQCYQVPERVDKNCISIQYVLNSDQIHERCIVESDECSTKLAMPVCIDEHLEVQSTLVPPITNENPAEVSVNVTTEYLCGNDDDQYHFIDDYCYKIKFHEVNWNDAKSECEKDNAIVFVPEKSITLQYIKSLFLRRKIYTSSGFAHVGVYYDNTNHTVVQYNTINDDNIPDSNAIYDLCEKTFQERYRALTLSSSLSIKEKNHLKKQQIGCAYIDLVSANVPIIRCDEIPCNRTATVICQKIPLIKTNIIQAKREYIESPSIDDVTNPLSTTVLYDDDIESTDI